MWRKALCVCLAVTVITAPLSAQQPTSEEKKQQTDETYMQGKIDGERDAKGNPLWFFSGSPALLGIYGAGCCGCIGPFIAYSVRPSPPAERLIGKPSEYVLGYIEAYQNKTRKANTFWASAGCLTFFGIALVIVFTRGGIIDITN